MINNFDISIKSYWGKISDGICVVVSIGYKEKIYEGIYWYTNEEQVLEVDDNLKKQLNKPIEEYEEYEDILSHLKRECKEYNVIKDELSDIDLEKLFNN